ncbi:uncharacterized protein LOC126901742 [Daktulosphaira vitifoliae]|uniref:uncharacterized protein LOC126901742 n=1 Tax=Daktulosphaira vitifoliae TaxID=58002 RepID=UPI0021AAA0FC|nr:uncharacterized protein LOC126901742 [Daktulosphaira vitifoliae]
MRFYFSFGILLCFICLIAIPMFSFGMPYSDEEINIVEEEYPISNYYKTKISYSLTHDDSIAVLISLLEDKMKGCNLSDDIDIIIEKTIGIKLEKNQKQKNILIDFDDNHNHEIEIYTDDQNQNVKQHDNNLLNTGNPIYTETKMVNLYKVILKVMEVQEKSLRESLYNGDESNSGTITYSYARQIFTDKKFFNGTLFGHKTNEVLNNYTDEQNQIKYNELLKDIVKMILEFGDDDEFISTMLYICI